MAFRDHLSHAQRVGESVSLIHEIWEKSTSHGHQNLLFENIKEVPGHRVSVNMLT